MRLEVSLKHLDEFVVEKVAFSHSQHTVLVEHLGIKLFQFIEQDLVFPLDVIRISRHHE